VLNYGAFWFTVDQDDLNVQLCQALRFEEGPKINQAELTPVLDLDPTGPNPEIQTTSSCDEPSNTVCF
jgi:hypothetical protein